MMNYTLEQVAKIMKEYKVDEVEVSDSVIKMKRNSKDCHAMEAGELEDKIKMSETVKTALGKEEIRDEALSKNKSGEYEA